MNSTCKTCGKAIWKDSAGKWHHLNNRNSCDRAVPATKGHGTCRNCKEIIHYDKDVRMWYHPVIGTCSKAEA